MRTKEVQDRPARAGAITADKIVVAAYLRGLGWTHDQIARELDVRNISGLVTALRAHGVPEAPVGPGMREVRAVLSNARHIDLAAMIRQAGYEFQSGLNEFMAIVTKDRMVRDILLKARR